MAGRVMKGRVCLITGATSGIGRASAQALAQLGAELFLICRSQEKGDAVADAIRLQTGAPRPEVIIADLNALENVRLTADRFLAFERPLHVLLNNAGVFNMKRIQTSDGLEEMFAVNHLAHFLLTNRVLDRIKASGDARIVTVGSGAHKLIRGINFDDPNFEWGFRSLRVYSHSKLANLLFTHELARRLEGSGVTANTVDPGEVGTNLGAQNGIRGKVFQALMRRFLSTPDDGARTSIWACTAPELSDTTGAYLRGGQSVSPKPWAQDGTAARRLWALSENLVNAVQTGV